jgi:hypothetical protein
MSEEMSACYVCLVISSVFKDEFEEQFLNVSNNYDFVKWEQTSEFEYSFIELYTDWVQMGSKYVKMVASAAKYALVREKKKKGSSISSTVARGKGFRVK